MFECPTLFAMPTTPRQLPAGYPPEPDRVEAQRHAGVFLEIVDTAVARDVEGAHDLLMNYLYPNGDPHDAEEDDAAGIVSMATTMLHLRYLAAVGPLLVAAFMNRAGAPVSPTWSRITANPAAATRPERIAVRAIAAHRVDDDETSRLAQLKLIDEGGYKALLQMVLVVIRICAELRRLRSPS